MVLLACVNRPVCAACDFGWTYNAVVYDVNLLAAYDFGWTYNAIVYDVNLLASSRQA